jgi:hypothetical protein
MKQGTKNKILTTLIFLTVLGIVVLVVKESLPFFQELLLEK